MSWKLLLPKAVRMADQTSASVIIITRNRPQMVRDCLEHLRRQTVAPDEVIVVDSSTGEDTQAVLDGYPEVVRLRIPDGRNNMPQARNLGIAHAHGEIIAFLDDDSMAQPDWLRCLLEPYADPTVGGVGGRVIDALEQSRATPDNPRIGVLQFHRGPR
jgi:glycosyltransferase involved in cell wall biosynthesis